MLAKLLGLIDLFCVLVLVLFRVLPHDISMFFAMLLFAKGMIFTFLGNKISILDAISGLYIGANIYGFHNGPVTIFFIVLLLQKGLLSLAAR